MGKPQTAAKQGAKAMGSKGGKENDPEHKEQALPVKEEVGEPACKRLKTPNAEASLPAAQVSALLGHMKYHAEKKNNEAARVGLEMWKGLDREGKEKFLKGWLECESKQARAAFKWIHSMQKTVQRSDVVQDSTNRAMRYGGEILRSAGLSFGDFQDHKRAEETILLLVQQNIKDFPQEERPEPQIVEGQPALSRWFFVKASGTEQVSKSGTTSSVTSSASGAGEAAGQQALAMFGLGEQPSGQGSEASEAAEIVDFRSKNKHLGSLTQALRKELARAEELECRLQVKAKREACLSSKATTLRARLASERAWVQAASMQCTEWGTLGDGASPEAYVKKHGPEQDKLCDTASSKLDAVRMACRDCLKYL